MLHHLSNKLVDQMVACKTIESENREMYEYGVYNMLATSLHVISIFVIGAVFGCFLESVLFYIMYALLRKFAGGYHANTSVQCYFCSCLCILAVIAILKWSVPAVIPALLVFGIVVSGITVWALAPVEHVNKPLDEAEVAHFRLRARIIWFIETAVVGLLWGFGLNHWALVISLSLVVLALALVLGKFLKADVAEQEAV